MNKKCQPPHTVVDNESTHKNHKITKIQLKKQDMDTDGKHINTDITSTAHHHAVQIY